MTTTVLQKLEFGRFIWEDYMIKAVIFDLDGVLVTTDKLHYLAWKTLADELGIKDFTEEDNIR